MKTSIIYDSQYQGYKVKLTDENDKEQRKALGKSPKSDADYDRAVAKSTELGYTISEKKPAIVAKIDDSSTLDGWITFFLTRIETMHASDTVKNYRTIIKQFQSFAKSKGLIFLDSVQVKHINEWVDSLVGSVKPQTIVIKLNAISALFAMALEEERIQHHPVQYPLKKARKVRAAARINAPQSVPKHLTQAQQDRYLRILDEGELSGNKQEEVRDIVKVMLSTGLRIRAAANLEFEFIVETPNGTIANIPKWLDKAKKGYSCVVLNRAKEVIERRRKIYQTGKVFPEIDNHKYVWHHIRDAIEKNPELQDILEMGCFNHSLRHTHATNLRDEDISLEIIQKQLGHLNITTTQIYAKTTDDTHCAALANIKM